MKETPKSSQESVDRAIQLICQGSSDPHGCKLPLQLLPWWKQSELMLFQRENDITRYMQMEKMMPVARHNFPGTDKEYQQCIDMCMIESKYLMSWRAKDAPLFTVFYRGMETEAFSVSNYSKTVFFSHDTGDCYCCTNPSLQMGEFFPSSFFFCII